VTGAVAATGSFAFQTVMMLIAFFFLLVDGKRLVEWLESVSPLKRGQTTELMREFRLVSIAVLLSSVATAGVQAVAALVGYLIARVPVPFFFAAVTFFVAMIPAVGAASVCMVAALLLLLTGHPWAALFLAIWGVVVVGLVDNVIKPMLVKRGLHMHGAIVFFALLGGLAAFGTVGLLIGPLIVSFFLALLRIHERDYGRATPMPTAPPTPPTPPSQPT
jgi:predicted PurR-regulated permease PerM